MDGNNRWASANKLPGVAGHQKGVERAREAVEFAVESGLKTLTLFAFSSENWGRSNEEVDLLMKLLHQALQEQIPNLKKNLVQLTFIGDLERFNPMERDRKLAKKLSIKDEVIIGYVGSIVSYEGLDLLMDALRLVIDNGITNFKMIVVGDGIFLPKVEERYDN